MISNFKLIFLAGIFISSFCSPTISQFESTTLLQKPDRTLKYKNGFPSELIYVPKGTGRTTGHIITLSVENLTDGDIYIPETDIIIQATENEFQFKQAYKAVFPNTVIEAYSNATVNIIGNCIDISLAPLGEGELGTPVAEYITSENMGPPLKPYFDGEDFEIPAWDEINEELQKLINKHNPNKKENPYEGIQQSVIDALDSYKRLLDLEEDLLKLKELQEKECEKKTEEADLGYDFPSEEELDEMWEAGMKELESLADKYDPEKHKAKDLLEGVPQSVIDALDSYQRLLDLEEDLLKLKEWQEQTCEQKTEEVDLGYDLPTEEELEDMWETGLEEIRSLADKYDPAKQMDKNPYEGVPQSIIDALDSYQRLLDLEEDLLKLKEKQENLNKEASNATNLRKFYNPFQSQYITYPGTNIPFPYKVDLTGDLKPIAPLIFEIDEQIEQNFTEALTKGKLDYLPIPKSRVEEELLQQIKWKVYAELSENASYQQEDLLSNTFKQIESNTGITKLDLPEQTVAQVKEGVGNIWESINYIGREAKVMKENEPKENVTEISHKHALVDHLNKSLDFARGVEKLKMDQNGALTGEKGGHQITPSEVRLILSYLLKNGYTKEELKEAIDLLNSVPRSLKNLLNIELEKLNI